MSRVPIPLCVRVQRTGQATGHAAEAAAAAAAAAAAPATPAESKDHRSRFSRLMTDVDELTADELVLSLTAVPE